MIVECAPNSTFAEGIAVRQPPTLTFEMVRDLVDEVITVTEEEMRRAIILLLEKTHNLAEGAGAAGLAGRGQAPRTSWPAARSARSCPAETCRGTCSTAR